MTHQPHHNEDATVKPVAFIEADDADALAAELEAIRLAHWTHWTAAENHTAATAARHLRLLAAHNRAAAPVEPVAVVAATDLPKGWSRLKIELEWDDSDGPLVINAYGTAQDMIYLDARLKFLHTLEKDHRDARPAELVAAIPAVPTHGVEADKLERALSELVDKIVPGLDTGDILADALTASKALDKKEPRNG